MVYQQFYLYVKLKLILFSSDTVAPEYVLSDCVKKGTTTLPFNDEELFVQSGRLET